MKKKASNNNIKHELIHLLRQRMKLLEIEKLHYEQNPTLMKNIRMLNIELIQNDLETLKETLLLLSRK